MSIQLTCPSGHTLTVADAWAGRSGRCPVCKAHVQVPALLATTPAVAASAATTTSGPSNASPLALAVPDKAPALQETPARSAVTNSPPPLPVRSHNAVPPLTSAAPVAASAAPPATAGELRALLTDPARQSATGTEPVARKAVSAKSSPPATPAKERTPQRSLPPQSAPPPLPIVVATACVAVAQPPAISPPPINGSAQLIGPGPGARKNIDAVFENIAAEFDAPKQSSRDLQSDNSLSTLVAVVEAVGPLSVVPLPQRSFDAANRQRATGYQPDADKRRTVYYLAAAMAALSVYCMSPALAHLNLGSAPNWARVALLLSLLQLAYAVWVASIPDWATLRSSMIIFTVVAALYGLTMTVALSTPTENTLPLDLTEVRRQAVLWCAGVVLLASLLAYCCGRVAWRWRRMLELLHV